MEYKKKKRIVVAMSGGVDSSTVAALLHDEGHEVIGVTLQLYDAGEMASRTKACCAGQDIYDAQMAAQKIGIPHYVLNYESQFKQEVIENFADSYLRGETPIPCVQCNQTVKFRDLLKVAKDLNADNLATGHYVQKYYVNDKAQMHKGIDYIKDQSYFLFNTTQEQIDYLLFPLGGFYKSKTRALASSYGLEIANKPDSQDICFVGNGSYSDVVSKIRPESLKKGGIIDKFGKVIGEHSGIVNYTVGQRRGIRVAGQRPLYVIKINQQDNTVVVGHEEDLYSDRLEIKDVNWLGEAKLLQGESVRCEVKLRSTHQGSAATIHYEPSIDRAIVKLDQAHKAITKGRRHVLYIVVTGYWGGRLDLKCL